MKKGHHIDITKSNCNPADVKKELHDFYSSISKNQDKHSIVKIKNKAKVTKMISNIGTMIQNSSNLNPYLEELSNIFIFLVSSNIEDPDIRNDAINCLFTMISVFKSFDKDFLSPIIRSLFTIPNDVDKKQKNTKKSIITGIFSRFLKQVKNENELQKKNIWYLTIFYCIFPVLKETTQNDPTIISECSYSCMESIMKIISRATEESTMDFFLKEENSFYIFESAILLKNLYKYSDDRKFAIFFYSRIFPCVFYYIDLDLSCHRFEKKDDMHEILESRRYSGWGGPNLLASFNSVPRPFFNQIVDLILTSKIEDSFMILLEPMIEALCSMLNKLKDSQDIAIDIIDLYFIIMRLRNVIKLCYKSTSNMELIDSSFTCMIMYVTQSNPTYKEYFPLFLSFYLTTVFDSRRVNVNEVRNFVKSVINLTNISESNNSNVLAQISVHVVALMTIAISPFLLEIPKEQSKAFLTNSMEMKISLKPLSLTLMRRITTSKVYFYMQIIGCDFAEIISQNSADSSSVSLPVAEDPNTSSNSNGKKSKKSSKNSKESKNSVTKTVSPISAEIVIQSSDICEWNKEKASKFILDLIEAIDPNVNYVASATIADILTCIYKETSNSNPDFIFSKILPILFHNAMNQKPEISVFMPVLRKMIRRAHRYGFLNSAMSHDWFRVIQKYIFSNISQEYKNELIFGVAQSITRGYPMSLSLIPIFVVFINNIINPDSSVIDSEPSDGGKSDILFSKNVLLICTCLADIAIISRNNLIFSRSNPIIDAQMKNMLSSIFDGNESLQLSFETILYCEGGLRRKCILLLKHIISATNKADLKNVENLILLLLFSEIIQKDDKNNDSDEINSIIESILVDNFLKTDQLLTLSLEFYHMLTLLIHYFDQVMKKFPNLISSIIYSISMVFVEQKTITIDQYCFLLRFVTNLSLVTGNNAYMYQCLNIISLPTTNPDKNIILNRSFNTFVYNYKKKDAVVSFKLDDFILLNQSGTIYSLKFAENKSNDKINSMMIQISHEDGANNYTLKFKNNFTKERPSITNADDSNNHDKPNNRKAKTNFKLFREFILYPSTALMFEFLSESGKTSIKGTSKNPNCNPLVEKAFTRDQHLFIDSGVIFIAKKQSHKEEFLLNEWENVSRTFYTFLSSIGHLYKPSEIPFLIDSSEKINDEMKNDEAVLCWNDSFHKVIYSVSTLSKYDINDRFAQRWNRFKNKRFLVFWSESSKQLDFFSEGFLSEGKLETAFVVKPKNKDMAILTIFQKRNNLPIFGFFKKEMVLPFDLIGFAISSQLILSYDVDKQLHSNQVDEFKQYKDLYENRLSDEAIMFKS